MSQISVVHYSPPLNKVNVLQQNNVSNKQNDRQIIVLRKPQHILPAQHKDFSKDDILITNNARKKQKSGKESKLNPLPGSVARRNARERNRVKQVNIGFATLRQHIPNFIAAAFESNSGRGGSKKLSKVETLRMAVEYIRSLEDVLATDGDTSESAEIISNLSYPSPSSSSTSPHHQSRSQTNLTYSYQVLSPPEEEDDASSIATPPPQQLIRINSSTSYQIIPTSVYEDGENLDPMVEDHILSDPALMDPLEFSVSNQDFFSASSVSPGMYSDASLSPSSFEESKQFIPVFNTPPEERLSSNFTVQIKIEENELPVISLKTENELPDEQKESIVDVLQWWEEQPQHMGS
ncbi:hypothetical protein NQ318_005478 [Aromia moschata]|uniref:BHLH domain-containing protein n=1 Tax=Aromia moschata TaxID=1265417 RepID=A0AAV8XA43_9CUCU|nr:hypothetical protein NQ318_005478 [Aromia moschata]